MALTGTVFTRDIPVPVRFGGPGSTSSERDCIIIGEFTPQMNKIRVRVKGIGKNQKTGVDNRQYERPGNLDGNIVGVVGRGEWNNHNHLEKQPEAALALHRGMDVDFDDGGDQVSLCACCCESGEIRYRNQAVVSNSAETLINNGQTPNDFYSAVADVEAVPDLSAELVWTFELEKVKNGQTRFGETSDADDQMMAFKVTVDWPYTPAGEKTFTAVIKGEQNAFYKNAYVFIGNPFAFWPDVEANYAMPGVQVLSVEYFDGEEPVVTAAPTLLPSTSYYVPVVSLPATDNVGVVSYLLTCPGAEPTERPLANDARWSPVPPNFADVDGGAQAGSGDYTFYPWVKDAAGNINSVANAIARAATVTLTIA